MKRLILALFLGFMTISCVSTHAQENSSKTYFYKTRLVPKEETIRVFLFTAPSWCYWCVEQEKELLKDEELVQHLKDVYGLQLLNIDLDRFKRIYESVLNNPGVPCWVVVDKSKIGPAKIVAIYPGMMKIDELKKFLTTNGVKLIER